MDLRATLVAYGRRLLLWSVLAPVVAGLVLVLLGAGTSSPVAAAATPTPAVAVVQQAVSVSTESPLPIVQAPSIQKLAVVSDAKLTVQSGDTMTGIASQNKWNYNQFRAANPQVVNPDVIYVGQQLNTPNGAAPPAATHAVTPAAFIKPAAPVKSIKTTSAPAGYDASRRGMWDRVAMCESTMRWNIANGNGFYGGLQFTASTWHGFGGSQSASSANLATPEQQIAVAERVLATQGPGAWPVCSIKAGLHR